jgi:hypothetical protein
VSPAPRGARITFDEVRALWGGRLSVTLNYSTLFALLTPTRTQRIAQTRYNIHTTPITRLKTTLQRFLIVSYALRSKHAQTPGLGMVSGYCSGFPRVNVTPYTNNYPK